MTAASINSVMDALGNALALIPGLRVFDFPPKSAQPPFAFVDMPDLLEYDCTFQRGSDRTQISVVVAVADIVDREVRDRLGDYMSRSGSYSVKTTLEAVSSGIGQSVRVKSADPRPVTIAGTTYMGVVFELDIIH